MASYLSRYLSGEHEAVWQELLALGAGVRAEPVYHDALAVARETMRRVRHNLELLVPRLRRAGYQFGYEQLPVDSAWARRQPQVLRLAEPSVASLLARFQAEIGVLPLSPYAWYEHMDEVNFAGLPPISWRPTRFAPAVYLRYVGEEPWALSARALAMYTEHPERLSGPPTWLDPLQVLALRDQFDLYVDWQHERDTFLAEEDALPVEEREVLADWSAAFPLELSPDAPLKYDRSGLGAYEVTVPHLSADALVLNEWHRTTFVDYLRTCVRWAGFPGFELYEDPPQELATLTEGCLPF